MLPKLNKRQFEIIGIGDKKYVHYFRSDKKLGNKYGKLNTIKVLQVGFIQVSYRRSMRNFIINDALYHDFNIFGTWQAILKSGKDNILPHPSYSSGL